jgi:hypothetical protein
VRKRKENSALFTINTAWPWGDNLCLRIPLASDPTGLLARCAGSRGASRGTDVLLDFLFVVGGGAGVSETQE